MCGQRNLPHREKLKKNHSNNEKKMKRIGKVLRSLFSRSSAVHNGQDEMCGKVSPPQDKDRALALQVIKTVEQKRLFLRPGLTVANVAAEMKMEADNVERLFNRFMGGDFDRYLDELRIAYAAVLLMGQESDLYSMEKIGSRCGFPDNDTFVGACRKLTGMTPDVVREFTRGRESLRGLFLNPPIYLKSDMLEEESLNTNT